MYFKKLYLISVNSNEILTKTESSELQYQRDIAKERKFYSIFIRIFLIYYQLLKQLYFGLKYKPKAPYKSNIISIYSTLNQKKAIDAINTSGYIKTISLNPKIPAEYNIFLTNFLLNALLTPVYVTNFLFFSFRNIGFTKTVDLFSTSGDKLILSLFYTFEFKKFIRKSTCKVCIFSNDHNCEIRSAAIELKRNQISIGYIQHSTIGESFPSLNLYDFAFLDGKQALKIYNNIDKIYFDDIKIYTLGALRFKNIIDKNKAVSNNSIKPKRVNIAINGTVSLHELEKLILDVKDKFYNYTIFVRPHFQQTNINDIHILCNSSKVIMSNFHEDLNIFLSNSDYLVTVSSGAVLDALRVNVLPILYIPKGKKDYFNFLKHGLVLDFDSFSPSKTLHSVELPRLIKNAHYFDSCIGENKEILSYKISKVERIIRSYE